MHVKWNMRQRDWISLISAAITAMMHTINVSRGEIVNNEDLMVALENGVIACAALDTVTPEPMPANHPLLNMSDEAMKKIIITTHAAGQTDEAFKRMLEWTIRDIRNMSNGKLPDNIVNI